MFALLLLLHTKTNCTLSLFSSPHFISTHHFFTYLFSFSHPIMHIDRSVTPICQACYLSSLRFAWLSLTQCTESQTWKREREREGVLCLPTWFWFQFILWCSYPFFFFFYLLSEPFHLLSYLLIRLLGFVFLLCALICRTEVVGYKP